MPVHHQGHKRCYSPADVRFVCIVATLRRSRVPLQTIRKFGPALRREIERDNYRYALVVGTKAFFADSYGEIVETIMRMQEGNKGRTLILPLK